MRVFRNLPPVLKALFASTLVRRPMRNAVVFAGFFAVPAIVSAQLSGTWPKDGGLITITATEPVSTSGLDFTSSNGGLIPVPPGTLDASSAPFDFLLANDPGQVTYASLGSRVAIEGSLQLSVGATADAEVAGSWGSGSRPVVLPMLREGRVLEDPPFKSNGLVVTPERQFLLHAQDLNILALRFQSASGGLIPVQNSGPFEELLLNTPNRIELGNTSPVSLDGDIALPIGWNSDVPLDLKYSLVLEEASSSYVAGPEIDRCLYSCPSPHLMVELNDVHQFVVHGQGHSVTELDFYSAGSLLPAASALPFAELSSNTAQHVGYRSAGSVVIDGAVTLSSGWDVNGTTGDVRYAYTELDGSRTGTLPLPNSVYPQNLHIDATVSDNNKLVLTGNGNRVSSVLFRSRSGSLIPGTSAAPFDTLGTNTPESVSLSNSQGNLILEGEVTLDVGWNAQGKQDIRVEYAGQGNAPTGKYFLSRGDYPAASGGDRPDVWLSLDEDYKLLLHSDDLDITALNLISADGALVAGKSPAPFQFDVDSKPTEIAMGNLGETIHVDGAIKLVVAINPLLGSTSLVARYGEPGSLIAVDLPVMPGDLAICPGCELPGVAIDDEGQISIGGFETPLTEIEATSKSGSLIPLEVEGGVFGFLSATENRILLTVPEEGLDAIEVTALPIAWREPFREDVLVTFTTIEGTLIGPFELPVSAYQQVVPEPSSALLSLVALAFGLVLRRGRDGSMLD